MSKLRTVKNEREEAARRVLHEEVGEHWWRYLTMDEVRSRPSEIPDPGAEAQECRLCSKLEWVRGPGY